MAAHKALKPFGWYPDGFTREELAEGDVRDFGANAAGLIAEGWIAEVGAEKPVAMPAPVAAEPAVEPVVVEPEPVAETPTDLLADKPAPRRGRQRK